MAGGHSIKDDELKYGLSVTGIIDPGSFASNKGLKPETSFCLPSPSEPGCCRPLKAAWKEAHRPRKLIYIWASRL